MYLENIDVSIAWKNLQYEIWELSGWKLTKKPILRQLNGHFTANSLNGLMGPSGAGKTTMLNCLSGSERTALTADSEIYLNSTSTSQVSYFIEQHVHENIVGQMSVGQVLRCAFRFKNGLGHSLDSMNKHIEQTMRELMLPADLLDRPFRRCSGGEQKRVAICQELMSLTKPSFLFLDEPTTGLDSAAALQVVQCLKSLTQTHCITIIASIHAPNNEMLNLFDKLYVLAKGGVCIYSGVPQQIGPFLEREIGLNIPEQQPPIEALVRLACDGIDNLDIVSLAKSHQQSEHDCITPIWPTLQKGQSGPQMGRKPFTLHDFTTQLCRLSTVSFIANSSTVATICALLLLVFIFTTTLFDKRSAVPSGCISLHNSSDQQCNQKQLDEDILLRANGTFLRYTSLFTSFFTMCIGTVFIAPLVKVFKSEHRNNWYSLGTFYLAITLTSILEISIYSVLISCTRYFASHQHAADSYQLNWRRFGLATLEGWTSTIYNQAIGQLIGTVLMDKPQVAIVASIVANLEMIMFNMSFFNIEKKGSWFLIKMSDLMAAKYSTKIMLYAFYGIDRCDSKSEIAYFILNFGISPDQIYEYHCRILINILVVKFLTFVILFIKFGNSRAEKLCQEMLSKFERKTNVESDIFSRSTTINNNHCNILMKDKHVKKTMFDELFNENKSTNLNDISIAWRSLSLFRTSSIYELDLNRQKHPKTILRNLNGQFRFGTLNALMGTSGAGKTSLLKVLNGQCKTRLSDSTQIYLSKFTKITTCFITQEVSGHLMPGLTAKQMLVYASRIKNSGCNLDHEAVAMSLLNELDLDNTESTLVERCSGGERKRLALALELTSLQMPNLVCIDEPTSGLDSNSAEIVISCLRKLTHAHNLTIIASIHQPNTEILAMFDQLYVLAKGGVCIYSGPPSQMHSHLASIPETNCCDSSFPIENLIKYSCGSTQNENIQKLIDQINGRTTNSQMLHNTQLVQDGVQQNRVRFSLNSVHILCKRLLSSILGHQYKELFIYNLIYCLFSFSITQIFDRRIAIPSGCISFDEDISGGISCGSTAQSTEAFEIILDNYIYTFAVGLFFLFVAALQSSLQFAKDYEVFRNEHRNGWYSSGAFYFTKFIFETIQLIPQVLIHVYICNFWYEIRPNIYWNLVLVLFLAAMASQAIGHICALWAKGNFIIQLMLVISVMIICILFSNFYIQLHTLHFAYQLAAKLSILRYTLEAFVLLQYGFDRCGPRQVQPILYAMGLEDADYYQCLAMLGLNVVIFRMLAIYLLILRANPSENRQKRGERIAKFQQQQIAIECRHNFVL